MLIAVSSFGESLRRVLLTAPAEATFNRRLRARFLKKPFGGLPK
jgi:hypothetical protein